MLSGEGVEPEVRIVTDTKALSAFEYESDDRLVIHLVNYNHDLETDSTNIIENPELEIALGEFPADGLTVTYFTPETPEGQELEFNVQDSTLSVTVPEVYIWGVLLIK